MHYGEQFVRNDRIPAAVGLAICSGMFKAQRAGTAAAIDNTDGNPVASFILNDKFCQISIEDFAALFLFGPMNHRCCDRGILLRCIHGDGDAGDMKDIPVFEKGTFLLFYYPKGYTWKTHILLSR